MQYEYMVVVYILGQGIAERKEFNDLRIAKERAVTASEHLQKRQQDFHIFVTDAVPKMSDDHYMEIHTPAGRIGRARTN